MMQKEREREEEQNEKEKMRTTSQIECVERKIERERKKERQT